MPTVENCFIFVAILGKKVDIYFFLQGVDLTTVIGCYLRYVAANFQWLYNEFGRVGYVNLTDDEGLFKEHEGDAKGGEGDAKEHMGLPRGMREMRRGVKEGRWMANDCSIVHPYYYHNHYM